MLAMLVLPGLLAALPAGGEGGRAPVTWSASSTGLPANANYYGTALGDFNKDGNLDIVGAAESSGLKVYLGNGASSWSAVAAHPAASGGFNDVRVGDINKDGNLDIVAGSSGIKIFRGNGAGGFTDISSGSGLPTSDNWRGISLGDVNKDGNLDIASTSGWGSSGGIRVFVGDGTGKFTGAYSGLPTSQDRDSGVVLADFSGDGNLDLAAGGTNGVVCYLGNGGSGGAMSWTSSSTGLPSQRYSGVNACDFNNDGAPDIILSAYNAGGGAGIRAFRNAGNAASWSSASTGLNVSGDFLDVSSADFDADGNADILTAGSYGSSYGIHVFYGNGAGSWSWDSAGGLPRGYQWVGSDTGDFNNDGVTDFVMGSYTNRGIVAYKNNREAPPTPKLSLLAPLGNVSWTGGSTHSVSWRADNGTLPFRLDLNYSTDGGMSFTNVLAPGIAQSLNGTGERVWEVPRINSTTVRVRAELKDARNQTVLASSPYNFEIDTAAPTVTFTLPANGARGVSNATPVRVRFSEPMNRSSAEAAVSIAGPGAPALSHSSWSGNELVFQTSGLRLESEYTVTVAGSALDDSDPGNVLAAPHAFTFNTSAAPVPNIYLSAPNGGELFVAGTRQAITWDASGGTGELGINLSYSTAGPEGPWTAIASGEANDGLFEWTVPDTSSANCFVNATALDSGAPRKSSFDASDMAFTIRSAPVPTGINITSPAGGEVWLVGSGHDITWSASGGTGNLTVSLQLSVSGPGGPWAAAASGEANDGSFAWTVPGSPSTDCFIRATVKDSDVPPMTSTDTSDAPFTIKAAPLPLTVSLQSPDGGENWTRLSRHDITWSAAGGNGALSIRLEYSTRGGAGPWTLVAAGEANDGRYSWNVPDTPSTDCHVRVTVTDSYDPPQNASDQSSAPFIISVPHVDTVPPTVSIIEPRDGAVVKGVVQVRASAADNVRVARVELYIDGALVANVSLSAASADWDTTKATNGVHAITARAWDAAGNAAEEAEVAVTVKNPADRTKKGARGFLETHGTMLVLAVVALVAVLVAAVALSRRKPPAPASAPEEGRIAQPPQGQVEQGGGAPPSRG